MVKGNTPGYHMTDSTENLHADYARDWDKYITRFGDPLPEDLDLPDVAKLQPHVATWRITPYIRGSVARLNAFMAECAPLPTSELLQLYVLATGAPHWLLSSYVVDAGLLSWVNKANGWKPLKSDEVEIPGMPPMFLLTFCHADMAEIVGDQ